MSLLQTATNNRRLSAENFLDKTSMSHETANDRSLNNLGQTILGNFSHYQQESNKKRVIKAEEKE